MDEALLQAITKKRKEMIAIGVREGLTSKRAVKCSQELDRLLNLYMKRSMKFVA
ncbi:stage 0 sporulation protein [Virgibacillus phasianinus]|uniref:Stage 0 sporulation protein n=1 Tax=Virgibacillus phasianinus TaxID=2017483 RepID=A0A220U7T7_9BACI|nr:aspartyl-phosphate phosphatase Spo0E family protein [Virgibacillus phasianinus]ASK63803.1 stage 0 sporulation protein [Virgibacillus phasianinus]